MGIPKYIASGSHYFSESRYRFLIMPRYKTDLHSIMKIGRLSQKHFLTVASQIIDVLMHLHRKNYVHSDIKAENIMIGLCKKLTVAKGCIRGGKEPFSFQIPAKNCRKRDVSKVSSIDNGRSRHLRPSKSITYAVEENSRNSYTPEPGHTLSDNSDQDEDFELSPKRRKGRRAVNRGKAKKNASKSPNKRGSRAARHVPTIPEEDLVEDDIESKDDDDRVYVIDYGLATKFIDTNEQHKPFCMDQRRAHDGTLEFTSRDAHFGAHSRRSDLECLGYNLIYWSQGFLPWKDDKFKEQPEMVHRLKEIFMTDVREMLKLFYGKDVPRFLGDFMHYVGQLEFDQEPDYAYLVGLFEKEFAKLGFHKADMKLNLREMRDQCEPNDKTMTENDLMMATITDLKTARKLGFLIATDSVDGTEPLTKPNEMMNLNFSCKASPKNLRSKEKVKGKRPKRQPKLTEKELISEKMAKGKKLSIAEIATLDPDQIARDRADREYEKFDEQIYYQTPQRYTGNPTYAIIEIENRLKNKHNGAAAVASNGDIEPIKGYTKPMMDVLKKQQLMLEQQITPVAALQQKKTRERLRNVIKPTKKNFTTKIATLEKKLNKRQRKKPAKSKTPAVEEQEIVEDNVVSEVQDEIEEQQIEVPEPPKRKRGRPKKVNHRAKARVTVPVDADESTNDVAVVEAPVKRKRGRPKALRNVIEAPETEEDSVYYDIPGEGSNDGVKEISEDEFEPEIHPPKKIRRVTPIDENSNPSVVSEGTNNARNARGRYYTDDDYDVSQDDETTNISSATNVTSKSSVSLKPRRGRQTQFQEDGISTRNKNKSRSTSRSAAVYTEPSDQSEASEAFENDSEFQMQSGEESEDDIEEQDQAIEYDQSESGADDEDDEDEVTSGSELADSNDSSDSIDIKYSPIKTRHARRRINHFNMKQIRGGRLRCEQFLLVLLIQRFHFQGDAFT
jgi:serine/threonine protein kinase